VRVRRGDDRPRAVPAVSSAERGAETPSAGSTVGTPTSRRLGSNTAARKTRSAAGAAQARPSPVAAAWPADALEVGRVVDAWGVKGWIKVQAFSPDPQALLSAPLWFLKPVENPALAPRPAAEGRLPEFLAMADVRPHGQFIVAHAEGIADRAAAEALRGARVFVGRSTFPETGEDEYYWADLIGLAVRNREGELLGRVIGLLDTGPQSVLQVQTEDPKGAADSPEILIPFVAAYIDNVDLERRLITVDWGPDF